jgi:hypothetical protein
MVYCHSWWWWFVSRVLVGAELGDHRDVPRTDLTSVQRGPDDGQRGGDLPAAERFAWSGHRAARTRSAASPAPIRRVSRSSTRVDEQDSPAATPLSSTSPTHRTCAAYNGRPTSSNNRPVSKRSSRPNLKNCALLSCL